GLQHPCQDAPPLSRRGLRSLHPGKKTPGRKAQRRFARRAPSLPGCLPWCSVRLSPFKPLRPGISRHKPPGCPVPLMLSGDIFCRKPDK
ncbi:hypothetical protein, partial [Klebsiella pneumoniae]|uniref:hypothetical protein n=1 Tax=Klebsiella pneumoniae TaxID=573 RepID=UPI0035C69474